MPDWQISTSSCLGLATAWHEVTSVPQVPSTAACREQGWRSGKEKGGKGHRPRNVNVTPCKAAKHFERTDRNTEADIDTIQRDRPRMKRAARGEFRGGW